jgi:hypothetical protein
MPHPPDPVQTGPTENDAPESQTARSPQQKQEFYWRRQAEKLEKELAALRAEREAELSRVTRDRDEAAQRAAEAEWRAQRLALLTEAGLSPELQALVPEADPETVAAYVEKLKPIAEKLARPAPRGMTVTNPPNPAGSDDGRLQRLASEASRGDRRALREYAHLRERVKHTVH